VRQHALRADLQPQVEQRPVLLEAGLLQQAIEPEDGLLEHGLSVGLHLVSEVDEVEEVLPQPEVRVVIWHRHALLLHQPGELRVELGCASSVQQVLVDHLPLHGAPCFVALLVRGGHDESVHVHSRWACVRG